MVIVDMVAGGIGVLAIVTVLWSQRRQRIALERLDERLAHLIAGVSLLTDTTEGGLRDVAVEVTRMGEAHAVKPRPRAATQRRVAGAVRRGRTVQDIAAEQEIAEGEVTLRLTLDQSRKEAVGAAVR